MNFHGYSLKKIMDETDTYSENPIFDFSWKYGQPVFSNVCGPMKDGNTMRYESWEVNDLLSR